MYHYGLISKSLTDLLKKDAFHWGDAAQKAFEKLRTIMSQAPVLALPNFKKPFTVETDAVKAWELYCNKMDTPLHIFLKLLGLTTKLYLFMRRSS